MAATIVWSIAQLDVRPADGALSDVVVTVHWCCTATDGAYVGMVYNTCMLPLPDGDAFIPYDELTQDIVLDWIWVNGVDRDSTEATAVAYVAAQQNPPIVSPPLPWEA